MRTIDLTEAYGVLRRAKFQTQNDARIAQRLIDKIADSDKFATSVFQTFNQLKLNERDDHRSEIESQEDFSFGPKQCGWTFVWNGGSYDLMLNDRPWLPNVDKYLTRKIVKDINVAYLIKAKRDLSDQE